MLSPIPPSGCSLQQGTGEEGRGLTCTGPPLAQLPPPQQRLRSLLSAPSCKSSAHSRYVSFSGTAFGTAGPTAGEELLLCTSPAIKRAEGLPSRAAWCSCPSAAIAGRAINRCSGGTRSLRRASSASAESAQGPASLRAAAGRAGGGGAPARGECGMLSARLALHTPPPPRALECRRAQSPAAANGPESKAKHRPRSEPGTLRLPAGRGVGRETLSGSVRPLDSPAEPSSARLALQPQRFISRLRKDGAGAGLLSKATSLGLCRPLPSDLPAGHERPFPRPSALRPPRATPRLQDLPAGRPSRSVFLGLLSRDAAGDGRFRGVHKCRTSSGGASGPLPRFSWGEAPFQAGSAGDWLILEPLAGGPTSHWGSSFRIYAECGRGTPRVEWAFLERAGPGLRVPGKTGSGALRP